MRSADSIFPCTKAFVTGVAPLRVRAKMLAPASSRLAEGKGPILLFIATKAAFGVQPNYPLKTPSYSFNCYLKTTVSCVLKENSLSRPDTSFQSPSCVRHSTEDLTETLWFPKQGRSNVDVDCQSTHKF
jgi:hypothetical protein